MKKLQETLRQNVPSFLKTKTNKKLKASLQCWVDSQNENVGGHRLITGQEYLILGSSKEEVRHIYSQDTLASDALENILPFPAFFGEIIKKGRGGQSIYTELIKR